MLFASAVVFVSMLAAGVLVYSVFLRLGWLQSTVANLALSFVGSLIVSIGFIVYPLFRQSQRRNQVENNLVYTTGYMGVLSSGGISIERIFNRVTQVEPRPAINDLARRFVADVRMLGMDVSSALEDVEARSPSDVFAKLLAGIANTIKTSGDLKGLLSFETKRLLGAKREQLKRTLGTLVAIGEVYVTAMVLAPITFIVMITILSVMGTVAFGISPAMQLNLIVFFLLPVLSMGFILMLNGILPEEE
jgi:flagellar protein FlaJ